jgi:iron(III) transport system substrate-binding protein
VKTEMNSYLTRRAMLRSFSLFGVTALVTACAQSAASPTTEPAQKPTTAPVAPATSMPPTAAPAAAVAPTQAVAAEWEGIVSAANSEKSIAVATYPGTGLRKAMDAFQAAYPGITVEHSAFQSASRDFAPRVLQELKAGLHSFDVAIMPPSEMFRQVRPAGGLDPIRPLIVQPDALDDRSWLDGFEAGFYDADKKWCYTLARLKSEEFWINTDEIKDGEITSFMDALDPKWKGRIIGGDPRTKGSGYNSATVMRLKSGDDGIIKRLYVDQEVVLGTDARQLTELMVRGRYVIGIGAVDDIIVKDFQSQGLGKNIKSIPVPDLDYVYPNASVAWYMKEAPHPNAAKVFINWLLSKDGGYAMSSKTGDNSRRADVPVADPTRVPGKGVEYLRLQIEEMLDEVAKTQEIAKSVLN